jgi:hypothetical protein
VFEIYITINVDDDDEPGTEGGMYILSGYLPRLPIVDVYIKKIFIISARVLFQQK